MLLRRIPAGHPLAGLSLLSLLFVQPILRRKVLPVLHEEKIAEHAAAVCNTFFSDYTLYECVNGDTIAELLSIDGFLAVAKERDDFVNFIIASTIVDYLLENNPAALQAIFAIKKNQDKIMAKKYKYQLAKQLIESGCLQLSKQQIRAFEHPVVQQYLEDEALSLTDVDMPGDVGVFDNEAVVALFDDGIMLYAEAVKLTPEQVVSLDVADITPRQKRLLRFDYIRQQIIQGQLPFEYLENWVVENAAAVYGALFSGDIEYRYYNKEEQQDISMILSIDGFRKVAQEQKGFYKLILNFKVLDFFLENNSGLLKDFFANENVHNKFVRKKHQFVYAKRLIEAGCLQFSEQQTQAFEHPVVQRYLEAQKLSLADVDVPGDVGVFDNEAVVALFDEGIMPYAEAVKLTVQQVRALGIAKIQLGIERAWLALDELKQAGNPYVMDNENIARWVELKHFSYGQVIGFSAEVFALLADPKQGPLVIQKFIEDKINIKDFDLIADQNQLSFLETPWVFLFHEDFLSFRDAVGLTRQQQTAFAHEGIARSFQARKVSLEDLDFPVGIIQKRLKIIYRLKQFIKSEGKEHLLDKKYIADQRAIAQCIVTFVSSKVMLIKEIGEIYDAVGIGFGNESGKDETLSVLRFRNLNLLVFFRKNMGYRETNDSEQIAKACIEKLKEILAGKEWVVADEEDRMCVNLLGRKIYRSTHNDEPIQWYNRNVRDHLEPRNLRRELV